MKPVRIVAFAGSAREGSYNRKLLAYAVGKLKEMDVDVVLFDVRDHPFPLFGEELEVDGMPENVKKLRELVLSADGVLIAAPEYNASVTPLLKNAVDWLSRQDKEAGTGNVWSQKVVGLLSASPGAFGGIRGLYVLRQSLINVGALALPEQASVGTAHEAFDENGDLKDARTAKFLQSVLERLVFVSERLRS